jgi:hypothetical protein
VSVDGCPTFVHIFSQWKGKIHTHCEKCHIFYLKKAGIIGIPKRIFCTLSQSSLTLCRRATQICVIALPCVVDGSHISAFSYTSSCTCVWHLIWLTYHFKFIISLMQDVGSQVTFKRPRNWGYLIKRPSGRQSVKIYKTGTNGIPTSDGGKWLL